MLAGSRSRVQVEEPEPMSTDGINFSGGNVASGNLPLEFFLRSSHNRVDLLSYERKPTDKRDQYDWIAEENLDRLLFCLCGRDFRNQRLCPRTAYTFYVGKVTSGNFPLHFFLQSSRNKVDLLS